MLLKSDITAPSLASGHILSDLGAHNNNIILFLCRCSKWEWHSHDRHFHDPAWQHDWQVLRKYVNSLNSYVGLRPYGHPGARDGVNFKSWPRVVWRRTYRMTLGVTTPTMYRSYKLWYTLKSHLLKTSLIFQVRKFHRVHRRAGM